MEGITKISVIIPCFNEEAAIYSLINKLIIMKEKFTAELKPRDACSCEFIFVDDCSTDATVAVLNQQITMLTRSANNTADNTTATVISHQHNKGIAGAIMTGIQHSSHDIVCTLDADGTYHPNIIPRMVALLKDDVSMVTASPYHPDGEVVGVPQWRLGLSKTASWLYGLLMYNKLYCYTSCVRVFRKKELQKSPLRFERFTGIVEMLWRVDHKHKKIVEYPAKLTLRQYGISKMRLIPTIFEQLKLMTYIYRHNLFIRN
jgi:dolichol-phosphate mannosyltransferase